MSVAQQKKYETYLFSIERLLRLSTAGIIPLAILASTHLKQEYVQTYLVLVSLYILSGQFLAFQPSARELGTYTANRLLLSSVRTIITLQYLQSMSGSEVQNWAIILIFEAFDAHTYLFRRYQPESTTLSLTTCTRLVGTFTTGAVKAISVVTADIKLLIISFAIDGIFALALALHYANRSSAPLNITAKSALAWIKQVYGNGFHWATTAGCFAIWGLMVRMDAINPRAEFDYQILKMGSVGLALTAFVTQSYLVYQFERSKLPSIRAFEALSVGTSALLVATGILLHSLPDNNVLTVFVILKIGAATLSGGLDFLRLSNGSSFIYSAVFSAIFGASFYVIEPSRNFIPIILAGYLLIYCCIAQFRGRPNKYTNITEKAE